MIGNPGIATPVAANLGGTGVANNAASTLTISGNFATTIVTPGVSTLTIPGTGAQTLVTTTTLNNNSLAASVTSLTTPSLTPVGDLIITQNSVSDVTFIASAATVDTLVTKKGRVGIGFTPDIAAANRSALQILGLGSGLGQITLQDSLTDATDKISGVSMGHFQAAWVAFQMFFGISTTGANTLNLGGGNSGNTSANEVAFYAGATTTTLTGTKVVSFTVALATFNVPVVLPSYTVATLPASPGVGATAFVTDASTTLILGLGLAVAGGGANKVPVYFDGAWKYG